MSESTQPSKVTSPVSKWEPQIEFDKKPKVKPTPTAEQQAQQQELATVMLCDEPSPEDIALAGTFMSLTQPGYIPYREGRRRAVPDHILKAS